MYDDLFTANKRESDPSIHDLANKKSVDDLQFEATLEDEYRMNLHLEQIGDNLRKAANAADRVNGAVEIIEQACKRNPTGLPW